MKFYRRIIIADIFMLFFFCLQFSINLIYVFLICLNEYQFCWSFNNIRLSIITINCIVSIQFIASQNLRVLPFILSFFEIFIGKNDQIFTFWCTVTPCKTGDLLSGNYFLIVCCLMIRIITMFTRESDM